MTRIFFCIIFLFALKTTNGQNFSGQWKGSFIDKSSSNGSFSGDKCDYVLELDVNKNKVSGASYTYFTENGKKYYTICKVEGTIDFKKKFIEVKETERTKTNIPITIHNCLQVHRMTYFKQGNVETLEGDWMPVPNQGGTCGFGVTSLTRRTLVNSYPSAIVSSQNKTNNSKPIQTSIDKPIKTDIKEKINSKSTQKEIAANLNNRSQDDTDLKNNSELSSNGLKNIDKSETASETTTKLVNRKNTILKTIEVENRIVKVELYDNGEVDGDSISLFYSGRLLLSNKRLTTKPITLTLAVEDEDASNELAMYAENLGSIPPNTALMIVTDGPNRYEVRITSDLEKSGVIKFVHKDHKP